MRALVLLVSLASWSGAQGLPSPAACPASADPARYYRRILRQLLDGLDRERHVAMSITLMYQPTIVGPTYSGGDTPPLSSRPSGTVFLGDDLLRLCPPDDEAAFALAHELAHIYLGHSYLRWQAYLTWHGQHAASMTDRSARRSRAARDSDRAAIADHESRWPTRGGEFGYGAWLRENARSLQHQEDLADEMGVVIAGEAGFEARSSVDYFSRLGHLWPGANIRDPFSDHPSAEDRSYNVAYWADTYFPDVMALGSSPPSTAAGGSPP